MGKKSNNESITDKNNQKSYNKKTHPINNNQPLNNNIKKFENPWKSDKLSKYVEGFQKRKPKPVEIQEEYKANTSRQKKSATNSQKSRKDSEKIIDLIESDEEQGLEFYLKNQQQHDNSKQKQKTKQNQRNNQKQPPNSKIQESLQQTPQDAQQIIDIQDMTYFIPIYKHKNYHSHIKQVLQKFAGKNPIQINLDEITKAIAYFRQQFMIHRQNKILVKKNSKQIKFQKIKNFHSNLAQQVFSKITRFIIQKQTDEDMYNIPIFQAGRQLCLNITKWQALYIMCCMTMCLIIEQKGDAIGKMYRFTHFIDFTSYFSQNQWKTRCILEYLRTQLNNYYEPKQKSLNKRMLTIKRVICPVRMDKILQEQRDKILKSVNVPNDDVTFDDFYGQLKLCHTNQVIGGGQALGGVPQEDIFFSAHTQLHILLVLCQQMNISDCVHLVGFRKYFRIERTKYQITFDGEDNQYPLDLDQQNRIRDYITFVNHPKLNRQHFREQFKKQPMDRQAAIYYGAIKSFMSIPHVKFNRVVSGHWACLIQWGDPRKKITGLWMAASMNNKDLVFCPYGEFKTIYDKDFFCKMRQKPVRLVYQRMMNAGKKMMIFRDNLHVFMLMNFDH